MDFYYGAFRPSDNYTTSHLLGLATTDDTTLRPFYRWILNKTIVIQDGALAEHTGMPARLYAEKFPKEFFEYMDSDTSGQKYTDWTASINYSGYMDDEEENESGRIRARMTSTMQTNCHNCPGLLRERIKKFAKDCFQ